MTPKEKAIVLTNRMKNCLYSDGIYDAKQCALVAVEEIIKSNTDVTGYTTNLDYWLEVKQEIEKL